MPENFCYPEGEFDLHGHTKYCVFPEFVKYSPEEAVLKAKEVGLTGIAITGHDTVRGLNEALDAGSKYGIIVVPGIEITSVIAPRIPHILALGINPDEVYSRRRSIPSLRSPNYVISWIHEEYEGLAIVAHPCTEGKLLSFSSNEIRELQGLIDGIEVATMMGVNNKLQALAKELNLPGLGSSDFHRLDQIGKVRTKVDAGFSNYRDVLYAIRGNRVSAFIREEILPDNIGGRLFRGILSLVRD